jgi:sporulation protein YlmC with PRC-barrel domain
MGGQRVPYGEMIPQGVEGEIVADIAINARVECTDGSCGRSTYVIINPMNHKVTHFVLQDKHLPDNPTRLVPAGNIVRVTREQIELNCAKADVAKMAPFVVSNFIRESAPGQAYASGQAYTSQYVIDDTAYDEVQERNVPKGEFALYSGMRVEACDGKVGKLDELVLDPQSGEVTNLLLREGHLWGKKEVAIPVSAIDFADTDTVYLRLDQTTVKALPAVPVRRP